MQQPVYGGAKTVSDRFCCVPTVTKNNSLELAEKYINDTNTSVFLTGKAGTGKTTFLRHIVKTVKKRNVVLAPTGVAAVNAAGVTIHSFFQLPLCLYLPDVKDLVTEYQMPDKHKGLRKERIKVIRTLELLIIDEISMVRADLLDAVDMTLRRYRRNSKPFGGVQLLLIGDLQQLPPVVTDNERPYLEQVYPSPFFFHSKALQRVNYVTIELTHIFRQQDTDFIALLNNIRENRFDQATLDALNARYQPGFNPDDSEGYIRLTTHNYQADNINRRKLDALVSAPFELKATVEGNFPETSYPTDGHLTLKKGAQVMFIKNDSGGAYYNGKIATVEGYDNEVGVAVVDQDGNHIVVTPERWENIKYEIDPKDNQIKQKIDGTFIQYPLRMAWAITIHKSQGLTFDKVVIDAAAAFTYGQVYVALSRCRTLEGIVLASPISKRCAFDNEEILRFNRTFTPSETLSQQLESAQSSYFFELLFELFDFKSLMTISDRINSIYQNNLRNIYPKQTTMMSELFNNNIVNINSVGEKFQRQLRNINQTINGDTNNDQLHERIHKAVSYFLIQADVIANKAIPLLNVEIENKAVASNFKDLAEAFSEIIGLKVFCLKRLQNNKFSTALYNKAKVDFLFENEKEKGNNNVKAKKKEAPVTSSAHPALENALKHWRYELAKEKNIPVHFILTQKSLMAIAEYMPQNEAELMMLPGIGKVKCQQLGADIIEIVSNYRREKGI